jgi:hypothetical protein
VADKRRVRRSIKDLQHIKTWQLLILLILVGFVAATFLRLNNIGMIERRTAVINADEAGDQEAMVKRLYDLQQYVSSHMNTDMGAGVYLESSFNRDYQAWQAEQYGDRNPNGNIYKKAQQVCAPKFGSYSAAYLQCTTSELAKYPAADNPGNGEGEPRASSYLHDYVSPVWSPDFAGWSVVACLVIIVMIVARLVSLGVLRLLLRRHYRSV